MNGIRMDNDANDTEARGSRTQRTFQRLVETWRVRYEALYAATHRYQAGLGGPDTAPEIKCL
jgi:hypothetical protein